jgi:hypothetical protein
MMDIPTLWHAPIIRVKMGVHKQQFPFPDNIIPQEMDKNLFEPKPGTQQPDKEQQ